jgi:multidrug efflux pump
MNISNFFIKRPIFAAVISIIIFVIGAIAYFRLPLSEYPNVVPPTVVVRTSYPGANPTVIADTVASPLEQQINGVEGMLYMFSQATADGVMTLTITFGLGTDLDKAQVQVQNRVSQALPRLPQEVQLLGVTTEKTSPDLLMVVHLVSPDNRYDMLYLANLAILQVKDELGRIPGVGNVQVFGAGDFSMRVWLNPNELASHNLTAADVVRSIREQNVQVAAGVLGAPPTNTGSTAFQLLVNTQGRLTTEEEFGNIIVRAAKDGQITRIRDLGRVELGSSTYALRSLLDNKPAAALPFRRDPAPTRFKRRNRSATPWNVSRNHFRKAWTTKSLTTPLFSCASRFRPWATRLSKPSSWSCLWCSSSCRLGEPPSFPCWRSPFRWWGHLRSCSRWASP